MPDTHQNPLKKIITLIILAITAFVAFQIYSIKTSLINKDRLIKVETHYFPILQTFDQNIARLEKIKEQYVVAVMTAEEDLLDDIKKRHAEAHDAFKNLNNINPKDKVSIGIIREDFNEYLTLGNKTSLLLIENSDNIEQYSEQTVLMNEALVALQDKILAYRDYSYQKFTQTLTNANRSTDLNLYLGIALGVLNLIFIGILAYLIKSNLGMLSVIKEHNKTLESRVAERTSELSIRTCDINAMLENMPLGVFAVIQDNKIHNEYSQYLETIVGATRLGEKTIDEVIFKHSNLGLDDKSKVSSALYGIIGEDEMMFSFNRHGFVEEMQLRLPGRQPKSLQLTWRPIVTSDGIIEKVLCIIQDVTELEKLGLETELQRKELNIIS